MDIRTKLVFALVLVSLVSMSVLGVFTVWTVRDTFDERIEGQLIGLVAFKRDAVEQVVAGWKDRVALVASRTQLRVSLDEHNRTGSPGARDRLERILADAADASPAFLELLVHDADETEVARVSRDGHDRVDGRLLGHEEAAGEIRYNGIVFRGGELPTVGFTAPLTLNDQVIGYLHAILATREIEDLSDNYAGLGETGETIVVAFDANDAVRTLHPLRFAPPGAEGGTYVIPADRAAARSLLDGDVQVMDGVTDYRGELVHVATSSIPETRWGLVVKIDDEELRQPITGFRQQMAQVAVTLAAFTILLGTFLGFRFAQPIHVLAETAAKIADGHLDARSGLKLEDEVGLLARTFDQMADSMEEQVVLLRQFRRFFDVSIDMLCIASTDGYFKRVNRAFVRELGWSEEELLKRPFISLVHPDDVQATEQEIQKLAGGTPTIRFTNRFLCMDGSYKRVRWNTYPEAETGRLYAIARVRSDQPAASGTGGEGAYAPRAAASDAAAEAASREAI
jgi:PAS domain S-box-containing protein